MRGPRRHRHPALLGAGRPAARRGRDAGRRPQPPRPRPLGRRPSARRTPMSTPAPALPPVAADVVADAVEALSPRLRKKLDGTIEQYAALAVAAQDAGIVVT